MYDNAMNGIYYLNSLGQLADDDVGQNLKVGLLKVGYVTQCHTT